MDMFALVKNNDLKEQALWRDDPAASSIYLKDEWTRTIYLRFE